MTSVKKFKTITQVAEIFKLPQHVLRFWESKFKQVKPLKLSGGRRYYRQVDIELIGYIKDLLRIDCISIKGVQKILGNKTITQILNSKNPVLKKKDVLTDNQKNKKNNLDNNKNKSYEKIFGEIVKDLKNIKNSF